MTFESLLSKNIRKTKKMRHTKGARNKKGTQRLQKHIKHPKQKKNILNEYKERTHVFSYYILKLFLIFDYKHFINSHISLTKQADNSFILNFESSLQNMQLFLNYIRTIVNIGNTHYINLCELLIGRIISRAKSSQIMSIIQIPHTMKLRCFQ